MHTHPCTCSQELQLSSGLSTGSLSELCCRCPWAQPCFCWSWLPECAPQTDFWSHLSPHVCLVMAALLVGWVSVSTLLWSAGQHPVGMGTALGPPSHPGTPPCLLELSIHESSPLLLVSYTGCGWWQHSWAKLFFFLRERRHFSINWLKVSNNQTLSYNYAIPLNTYIKTKENKQTKNPSQHYLGF